MMYTDNPSMDAESYQFEFQNAIDQRDYIVCDICKGRILRADQDNYGDELYKLDRKNICEKCIDDYIRSKREELR